MDDVTRGAVRSLALGRMAIGAACLLVPGLVGRGWIGPAASGRGVKALVRALGVRDVVVGLGTLITLDDDRPVAHWLWFGAACDAVDAAATLLAAGAIPKRSLLSVGVMAGSGAVLGARLAQQAEAEALSIPDPV
jgi:hypothetical protein